MVSSAPAPLINPPVSYAQLVKKAHSPRSPNLVRHAPSDFPSASNVTSTVSPTSNATSQLPKPLTSVEALGRSQAGASDFPELPTEVSSQNTSVRHLNGPANHSHANSHIVPKTAPAVNVWTERLKEHQMALGQHQAQRQPRATAASSVGAPSVLPRLRPIAMGTPLDIPNNVSSASTSRSSPSQTISLNGNDSHDPFVVRMPPHLSRHSSSKSIRLVNESDAATLDPVKPLSIDLGEHDSAEKPGRSEGHADAYNSSNSADISGKNSIDSTRHQSDSRPSSAQMSRLNSRNIFEMNSTGSHSMSHSRVESHAGSSSSSPRLQFRGRRLPDDDVNVGYDARPEPSKIPYNPPRMSSTVSERTAYHHHTLSHHSADFASHYYRSPPMPSTIDTPLHPARLSPLSSAIRHPYALPSQHYASPGHSSPTYVGSRPPSGAGTPPYPAYTPYTAPYGYNHSHIPWDGYVSPIHPYPIPGYSPTILQSEYNVNPPVHLSFFNPALPDVVEPLTNSPIMRSSESSQDSQFHPAILPRNMVFGSIGRRSDEKEAAGKEGVKESVQRVVEPFSRFSIGVTPGEPGPFRQGNRKPSNKNFSRPPATPIAESTNNPSAVNNAPQEEPKVTDEQPVGQDQVAAPGKKWEFGTTTSLNEDGSLEDPSSVPFERGTLPADCVQLVAPLPSQHPPVAAYVTQLPSNEVSSTSIIDASGIGPSIINSEDGSATSDVWEVKDYGFGFGDVSGTDNATDVIRRAKETREKQRQLEWQKEHAQKQLQKQLERQLEEQEEQSWPEVQDEREVWDQAREYGRGRPRRGSWAGSYTPHERGNHGGRRPRGFGGRYHARYPGRGSYHYQQRPSISLTPPPQFNPLPLPGADYLNGYVPQMPSYTPPEYELYNPVPATIPVNGPPIPMPQSALPFPLDPTRSCLLGQLEYYLSPQNLAQDFFLRQRMDDQGWIPISLITSFNRVKQLTREVQLVRDVLNLSSLTEVKGEYVRMAREQWKQFVLPSAPRSILCCHPIDLEATKPQADQAIQVQDGEMEEEGDTYAEDDDEEDIVFVIGEEAEGSWAPERRPTASEST